MKRLSDYQESLDRYKKYFPQNCVDKTDVEILLYRKIISKPEAMLLENPPERIKKALQAVINPKSVKKTPVMTEKQFLRKCHDAYADWAGDHPEEDVAQVAYDIAGSLLCFDMEGFTAYLNKQGIDPKYHKEALAEYIHG